MLIHLQPKVCSVSVRFDGIQPRPDRFFGPNQCCSVVSSLLYSPCNGFSLRKTVWIRRQFHVFGSSLLDFQTMSLTATSQNQPIGETQKEKVPSLSCGSAFSQIKSIPWCIPAGKVISGEPCSLFRRAGRGTNNPSSKQTLGVTLQNTLACLGAAPKRHAGVGRRD